MIFRWNLFLFFCRLQKLFSLRYIFQSFSFFFFSPPFVHGAYNGWDAVFYYSPIERGQIHLLDIHFSHRYTWKCFLPWKTQWFIVWMSMRVNGIQNVWIVSAMGKWWWYLNEWDEEKKSVYYFLFSFGQLSGRRPVWIGDCVSICRVIWTRMDWTRFSNRWRYGEGNQRNASEVKCLLPVAIIPRFIKY